MSVQVILKQRYPQLDLRLLKLLDYMGVRLMLIDNLGDNVGQYYTKMDTIMLNLAEIDKHNQEFGITSMINQVLFHEILHATGNITRLGRLSLLLHQRIHHPTHYLNPTVPEEVITEFANRALSRKLKISFDRKPSKVLLQWYGYDYVSRTYFKERLLPEIKRTVKYVLDLLEESGNL